jgi:hypothetical protein
MRRLKESAEAAFAVEEQLVALLKANGIVMEQKS